jgi:hypothetical protein
MNLPPANPASLAPGKLKQGRPVGLHELKLGFLAVFLSKYCEGNTIDRLE